MRHFQLAGTRVTIRRLRYRDAGVHLARSDGQLGLLPHTEAASPSIAPLLTPPADAKRIGGYIVGDHRAGVHNGAITNFHRRHQRRIGTDEGARADFRVMLAETIIVAGDGARPDVGPRADTGVADMVLSTFGASGAGARIMPTRSCIKRRRSGLAARRYAGCG
jgi:hypothetical protein